MQNEFYKNSIHKLKISDGKKYLRVDFEKEMLAYTSKIANIKQNNVCEK